MKSLKIRCMQSTIKLDFNEQLKVEENSHPVLGPVKHLHYQDGTICER